MLCLSGNYVTESTISNVINLIVSTRDLHIYSVHKLYFSVKNNQSQEGLVKVALYAFGEYGDLLVNNSVLGSENETINVTDNELLTLISEFLDKKFNNITIKEYLLNTLVKLSVKLNEKNHEIIKLMVEKENFSFYPEVQQRASEYLILVNLKNDELKHKILDGIPISKILKENDIQK